MKLLGNTLAVHGLRVTFQRTLRIPNDGSDWPLPPGLGAFPLRAVDDYLDTVPESWRAHGGVFMPMYQREAMWACFSGEDPHAIKVGVGKRCAVTGKAWKDGLRKKRQDYLVSPPQPWLDGICVGEGRIRQFVAMPLGRGATVEGQLTGKEEHGGLQLSVMPPKPGVIPPPAPAERTDFAIVLPMMASLGGDMEAEAEMGLAAGGSMVQKVYPDPHGRRVWDQDRAERVFVHLCNIPMWTRITGESAPTTPVTVERYQAAGLPWFSVYDEHQPTLKGTKALRGVKTLLDTIRDGAW